MLSIKKFLKNTNQLGIKIKFKSQDIPLGIAHALKIATKNTRKNIALILGDNIFYGHGFNIILKKFVKFDSEGQILINEVKDPSNFGILPMIKINYLLKFMKNQKKHWK